MSGSVNSHWKVVGRLSPWAGLTCRRIVSNSSATVSGSRSEGPSRTPITPALASARPRWEISSGERPGGSSGGPGSVSIARPAERSLVVIDCTPSTPTSSKVALKTVM